jgi:hypothetical protein
MRITMPKFFHDTAAYGVQGVESAVDMPRATGLALLAASSAAVFFVAIGCGPTTPPAVPTDAVNTCPLTSGTFSGWFQSGSVTLNGVVNPADSTQFLTPNCGFYQWSENMFLWLNSPAPSAYGGGAHIFDSPAFYDVSPPDPGGNRTFIAHTAGLLHAFPLRAAQVGAHGLQLVTDLSGKPIEVRQADPKLQLQVKDPTGKLVQVFHARIVNGETLLLDSDSKVISTQHVTSPIALGDAKQSSSSLIVQKFNIDGISIFQDSALNVVDVEQGQAVTDSVLEAQTAANGSLIYYATMVNDVYAYFATGAKKGQITTTTPNQFPTTASDLSQTVAFATANGKGATPFPDPKALAIEVKSSWVLAAGLPNLSSYITMTATIPTYDKSNPAQWKQNGQQTVQLAMVGMHVVGSTAGHPEMVWATFEHTGNTPIAGYSYNSTSGPKNVGASTVGPWVFSSTGTSASFNQSHMTYTGAPANTIQPVSPFTISPSDTQRTEPWGIDGSNASSNTQVISMNNNVLGMLSSGDIRGNYIMTGATWTPNGSNPSGSNPGVGTNKLSNSTMETYVQGSNCFGCHQNLTSGLPNVTTDVSHIFTGLKPLF